MQLAVYTQFVRNFLCICKSLLPTSSPLHQVALATAVHPLNEVTWLELCIGITQFLAVLFCIISSYTNFIVGARDYFRSSKAFVFLDRLSIHGGTVSCAEYTILRHGVLKDQRTGVTKMLVGGGEFVIACSFVFLATNSFHVRGPTHPLPLYHALIAMEIALVYFLYLMWGNVVNKLRDALKFRELLQSMEKLEGVKVSSRKFIDLSCDAGFLDNLMETYLLIDNTYAPVYRRSRTIIDGLREDLKTVHNTLDEAVLGADKEQKGSAATKALRAELRRRITESYIESFLEFIFLLLNLAAGLGYLMGIMAFFFPLAYSTVNMPDEDTFSHFMARACMLQLPPSIADWYGNFAGDLAWTIEPLLVLCKPAILHYFAPVSYAL